MINILFSKTQHKSLLIEVKKEENGLNYLVKLNQFPQFQKNRDTHIELSRLRFDIKIDTLYSNP